MRPYLLRACLLCAAILLAVAGPAHAWEMVGTKQLELRTRDGTSIPIGTVMFTPGPDATRFAVTLDRVKFKDYFLSMSEFKCVEGPEVQCQVPYPYANPGTVRPGDFAWLEHATLFLYKAPADYGAKLSNGLYYVLQATDDGRPMSVDLNDIAAPPQDPSDPPFDQTTRADIIPGTRWIDVLIIR